MKDHVSWDDHRSTLAWVDNSLERARSGSRTKLLELLSLVRTEVLLDMQLSESPPSTQAPADGSALGANRGP